MDGDLGAVTPQSLDDAYQPPIYFPPVQRSLARTKLAQEPSQSKKRRSLTRSTAFPEAAMDNYTLTKLQRWIVCFAVVEFNLDTGPDLDNVYPPTHFSAATQSNIAFSSLPEGELPTAGAHAYSWRIPPCAPTEEEQQQEGFQLPDSLREGGDGWLYGFVWFAQEKGDELRRGYSQRSLVLITHLPGLPSLFMSALAVLGPLHFKHLKDGDGGGGMVEAAAYNIASWPDRAEGTTIDLPFLGTVLSCEIPLGSQPQWVLPPPPAKAAKIKRGATIGSSPSPLLSSTLPLIPASLPPTPLSLLLSPSPTSSAFSSSSSSSRMPNISFTKLLLLWELVLLGEPILVVAGDPRSGGEVVAWLRALIRPILFAGDYRPYYHIHDADFSRVAGGSKPPPATIISTTNPHIVQTCSSWPHVLRLSVRATDNKDAVRGLKSTRKRHVSCDKKAREEIERAMGRGDYLAADALILQHLARLTELFLAPLNRYFGTLPAPSPDGSLSAPSAFRSFTPSQFLASLKTHGSSLPLKPSAPSLSSPSSTALERFYARFLQSPNFASWLHERMDRAGEQVREGYLRRLEVADLRNWMDGDGGDSERGDHEVDELVERIEKEASISESLSLRIITSSQPASPLVPSPLLDSGSSAGERSTRLWTQAARLRSLRAESRGSGGRSTASSVIGGSGSSEEEISLASAS